MKPSHLLQQEAARGGQAGRPGRGRGSAHQDAEGGRAAQAQRRHQGADAATLVAKLSIADHGLEADLFGAVPEMVSAP
jgi:hypothetical protein